MAAWKGSKIMEEYSYILFIALILLSTKILGLVTKKMKLPQVVGALLAGVILGPAVLNVVKETVHLGTVRNWRYRADVHRRTYNRR